jgi:hypothetical protein
MTKRVSIQPFFVAVERRDLLIDPVPIDLAGELHQIMFHVDNLVQPGSEQIAFTRRLRLPSLPSARCANGIMTRD